MNSRINASRSYQKASVDCGTLASGSSKRGGEKRVNRYMRVLQRGRLLLL